MDIIAQGIGTPSGIAAFLLVGLLANPTTASKIDVAPTDALAYNLAAADALANNAAATDTQSYTVTVSDATRA